MTVKGKIKLCQSNLGDFNVEQINGSPFYNRYGEFLRVFKKHMQEFDPEVLFAQPEENTAKGTLDWYIPNPESTPVALSSLKNISPEEFKKYDEQRIAITKTLSDIASSITNNNEKEYFDCALKFLDSDYADKVIYCHDDKITFAVWGMKMRKGRDVTTVITDDVKDHRVHNILFKIQGSGIIVGNSMIKRMHGHTLSGKDIPEIKPDTHFSFVEWKPEAPHGKEVTEDSEYTAVCKRTDDFEISFVAEDGGKIEGDNRCYVKPGDKLIESAIPSAVALEGYKFIKWIPEIDTESIISNDIEYKALFEELPSAPKAIHKVNFVSGDNGSLKGSCSLNLQHGETIPEGCFPIVEPHSGYKFTGWDKSTIDPITCDQTYYAQYEKIKIPWYKRWWLWLTGLFAGKGCLKWLLWLLVFILVIWLLSWLLRGCIGCTGSHPVNGVVPIDTVKLPSGKVVDNNGRVHPVTGADGRLPDGDMVVAPVMGEDGDELPIIEQPGMPNIFANRLFLFMENENDDIDALARDFKKAYPEDKYSIIGFDKEVKLLVIQIPEEERDQIRKTINSKIPNHKFIVFDEEVYELNGYVSNSTEDAGWHLDAIHLKQGWSYTKGNPNIKVAIVDDGIQYSHPMFEGRIVDAYNVFTQNNSLSLGVGHGTHTAGLAVGSDKFYSKGASGVAPNCMIMPIQVIDNSQCPLSALVAGVMYALHHDADVVNISIGPSFQGMNVLPVEQQEEIAQTQFQNVAFLWARVCRIAAQKKSILVFAAGNDDILTSIPPENRNASSIVVTAVDKRLYPTVFTNYGPCSDISAPGKGIYSSFNSSSFQSCDGTSMAAPIVTGTIALMKSIKKDLTVEQAKNALFSTGADVYGWIPPMVLVDKVLAATKKGDFKKIEREGRSVPDGVDVHMNSGRIPVDRVVDVGVVKNPVATPEPPGDETDYEEIRRQIAKYEELIKQLKQKLPENKN